MNEKRHFLYERFSESYERIFSYFLNQSYEDAEAIIRDLPAEKVLEVGIGPGTSFHIYPKQSQVLGVDPSESMLARARQKLAAYPNVSVEQMDGERLALDDNTFDLVTSFSVITVVPQPELYLNELIRVARPGGHILLTGHFQIGTFSSRIFSFLTDYATRPLLGFRMDLDESILHKFDEKISVLKSLPTNSVANHALSRLILVQKKA